MTNARSSDTYMGMSRSQFIKGAFAAVVILLCFAYLAWVVWPKPEVVIPPQNDTAAQWTRSYGAIAAEHATKQDAFYWATVAIVIEPTQDNQQIVVRGKVRSQAQLDLLKSELGKVTPAAPLQWQVKVAP